MAILGLGNKVPKVQDKKDDKKADDSQVKQPAQTSQADEAKAMLAKMAAKKDAGDCPFC